jgi:hypothetical protein
MHLFSFCVSPNIILLPKIKIKNHHPKKKNLKKITQYFFVGDHPKKINGWNAATLKKEPPFLNF